MFVVLTESEDKRLIQFLQCDKHGNSHSMRLVVGAEDATKVDIRVAALEFADRAEETFRKKFKVIHVNLLPSFTYRS